MKYTNHLNLKKPESNDYFDQENHANYNMDVIDGAISGHLADKENPHNITTSQIGAVPTTRTVNGKALSSNVSINASDVGAATAGHAHSAADINAGTLNVARIPTGTTSSTVALGNHTHNASAINAGTLNIARIPTGSTSSTIALGNHTHAYAPLTGGGTSGTWAISVSGNAGSATNATQVGGYTAAQLIAASSSDFMTIRGSIVNLIDTGFLNYTTILNLTGKKGKIKAIALRSNNTGTRTYTFRITIDGVQFQASQSISTNEILYINSGILFNDLVASSNFLSSDYQNLDFFYRNSIKIECQISASSGTSISVSMKVAYDESN